MSGALTAGSPPGNDGSPALLVVLRRSGATIRVPAELTVLEALERAGIAVPAMCRSGICGTCETTVLGAEFGADLSAEVLIRRGRGCAVRLCTATGDHLTRLIVDL
ncbi:2Fe-2S iron-sulfur cluster-binding protein [Nocardia brasiliensis]|uniref:2Fe-2S iron-sulfur cluster-binding protein n=1 Tax=Nocardia brasiliensis TaxID=37326 RepID=UPI003407F774